MMDVFDAGEDTHQPRGEEMQAFAELLTYENLGNLNYLHAALTETMRLYPPVPLVILSTSVNEIRIPGIN